MSLHDIQFEVRHSGYSWDNEFYGNDHNGFILGLNQIRTALSDNRPVVLDLVVGKTEPQHAIVWGIDESRKVVTLQLPNEGLIYRVAYDSLERQWFESESEGQTSRDMLITWPKPLPIEQGLHLPPSGKAYFIVPECVCNVLGYYGDSLSQHALKECATGTLEQGPVYFTDVVRCLRMRGYLWRTEVAHTGTRDQDTLFEQVLASLDDSRPVILTLAFEPFDLPVIVTGYSRKHQTIRIKDLTMPAPGNRFMSFAQFKSMWHETDPSTCGALFTSGR